jgi:hypothetical protein
MISAVGRDAKIQRPSKTVGSFENSYDPTFIPTISCIGIAAIVAIYALVVSNPPDPNELIAMGVYP